MEEIWKDIPNLSSLPNHNNSFDAMNLQEFLARPFLYPNNYNINPVFPATTAAPTNLFSPGHATNNVVLLRPQGNSLSTYQPSVSSMACSSQQQSGSGSGSGMGMQGSGTGSARKRIASSYENNDQNSSSSRSDRHHQRLIKNRESAARSRVRKEAYTSALEEELTTLKAENEMLKKEQKLREAARAPPKNRPLNRSLSFP